MPPSTKNGSNFAVFDNLLEGCQIIDFEWRYIYLNDTAIVHAHRDRQELIGKTMMECYAGIEKTPVFAVLKRVMGDRKAERLENEFTYPDGQIGWFELQVQPCAEGILILTEEITDTKLALQRSKMQISRLHALHQIDLAITSSVDLSVVSGIILDQVTSILGVDAADILLFDPNSLILRELRARGFHGNSLQNPTIKIDASVTGRTVLERKTAIITDLAREPAFTRRYLIEQESFTSYAGTPLIAKGQLLGVLECFHRQEKSPNQEWVEYFEILAGQTAIAIDHIRTFDDLQKTNVGLSLAYDSTIEGWAGALELRDIETEGHSRRVAELTLQLARMLLHKETELVQIRRGAMLHDIGKMGIPDEILFKPGKLTKKEWALMHQHPVFAHNLLSQIEFLKPALDIPYCHHEKWDGTGYPRGLKGDLIPEAARIFAVVDVWDALRSDRPYRPKWGDEKALAYIKGQSGKHFDPQAVASFEKLITG